MMHLCTCIPSRISLPSPQLGVPARNSVEQFAGATVLVTWGTAGAIPADSSTMGIVAGGSASLTAAVTSSAVLELAGAGPTTPSVVMVGVEAGVGVVASSR